jgi:NADH:ubiquinone oxidoreductase subunit E
MSTFSSPPLPSHSAILAASTARQDQLLPALHAIQDALGYIPPEQVPLIASISTCRAPKCTA